MLKIRLQRVGRTHEPSFRLVLTDSQNSSKSGRFKEILGSYDPRKSTDSLDIPRIQHWLSVGATPTDTIHNLLVRHKVIQAKKINVSAKSKKAPVVKEEVKEVEKVESKAEEVEAPSENAIIEPVTEEVEKEATEEKTA